MIVLNCLVVFSLEKVEKMVPPFTAAAGRTRLEPLSPHQGCSTL